MATLTSRVDSTMCYNSFNQQYYCHMGWSNWGRWLVLGAIVVVVTLVFLSCFLTQRHRRRQGLKPYKGTGWIGKAVFGHSRSTYDPQVQQQQQSQYESDNQVVLPPSYQQNGGYSGQNQGYFEGQQHRTELRQPPNAYHSGEQPLSGFNPKEDDGVVR